jgi:hypothetical protein
MANIAPATIARYRNNLITPKSLFDQSELICVAHTLSWLTGRMAVRHSTEHLEYFTIMPAGTPKFMIN